MKRQFGIFYKDFSISITPIENGTEKQIANAWYYYGTRQIELMIRPMDDIFGPDEWIPGYNADTGYPLNILQRIEY